MPCLTALNSMVLTPYFFFLLTGLKVRQDAKKQHKQSIEKTYRRQEQGECFC